MLIALLLLSVGSWMTTTVMSRGAAYTEDILNRPDVLTPAPEKSGKPGQVIEGR